MDNTVEVETPELVRFRYRVAGPVRRGFAYFIDLLIRGVVLVALATALAAFGLSGTGKMNGIMAVSAFGLEWLYYVVFETSGDGRTPGKRAFKLRVVKEGGFPVGFIDSVLRNLLRAADFLPVGYALGLAVMAGDHRFRRLGDRVAGTLVVIDDETRVVAPLVLAPAPTADELAAFPQRPPLTAWERETLELFLRRTDLTEGRREELALSAAPVFAQRMSMWFEDPVRFLALLHHRVTTPAAPGSERA
ncbi:MAG TPA: RDD family protein [Polyangia bacterium]|nr:RDD family protein [Polyangia bacterium]